MLTASHYASRMRIATTIHVLNPAFARYLVCASDAEWNATHQRYGLTIVLVNPRNCSEKLLTYWLYNDNELALERHGKDKYMSDILHMRSKREDMIAADIAANAYTLCLEEPVLCKWFYGDEAM